MTRFELLNGIATPISWVQFEELAFPLCTRSEREAMRTQLQRLHRWGLVQKQRRYPWRRDPFAYKISLRGRERLAWARQKGLLP
ncbi:MAG: hypothetical protein ABSA41_12510 [Terriglobia bacterium]|jgi:hypothetical protein